MKEIRLKKEKNDLNSWLFAFGFVFAFFHIMPAILQDYLHSPLTFGDTLDFLTPFAFVFLTFILYSRMKKIRSSLDDQQPLLKAFRVVAKVFLAVGLILFVNGQGIHLSANSISRLIENSKGSELYKATYLFDEVISHFMWDSGVFLVSLGLIVSAFKLSSKLLTAKNTIFLILGACLYGFTFTVNGIEGQTVVFSFPASGFGFLLALLLYFKQRGEKGHNSLLLFFISAYFLSLLLFAYWGISRPGFPEFSELGWI